MIVKDITRLEARAVLTSPDGWRAWQIASGGNPCELAFDPLRDVWTVSIASDEASPGASLSVRVMTDGPTFQSWPAPDVPTALGALGAFVRKGPGVGEHSDLGAIETYVRDHWPRTLLSLVWGGEYLTSLWASAMKRHSMAGQPRPLHSVRLHPLDLFDKYGFDEGEILNEHLQALRAEGWYIGPDELLWAVIQDKVLPLLDPRPELVRVVSSHNNVQAFLEGYDSEIDDYYDDDRDLDFLRGLTPSWPATIKVGGMDVLAIGRAAAAPLTARIRALEAALAS
jgi:hypothetical protein